MSDVQTGKYQFGKFEVVIFQDGTVYRGYFEHEVLGDERGGGLWFLSNEQGKQELIDYDGVGVLPKPVAKGLVELGFYLDPELYEEELA